MPIFLPLTAARDDFHLRARGEDFTLEPGELPGAQHCLRAVIHHAIGGTMIAIIEHEEIDVAPREFEVDTRIVALAVARVGPELLKSAQRNVLPFRRAARVVRPEIMIIPDRISRDALCDL